ncbi:putative dehydrogenase [Motilibacter rhizosphaerae]|uniref:Putative dehydrogenase n=1 Tax=Motilibacter rhizosphaerae TaxID=598652 RepID=A0A4Q7NUW5_9ACTN|nr:Gfo/Idh/MocA family oxidoreductase [Motilibacter rhizosphaerae]RZS90967.1 putative dehydrogenase [Motilibacter rhizosphaerae]
MATQEPVRFAVVGSGWRSQFFLRLARMAPEQLQVSAVVTRTAERGEQVTAEWGVPTFRTLDEVAATAPEYVVPSVPWGETPAVTERAVELGYAVLAETPPAADADGLRALWSRVGASGRVQVAEQYLLMPGHAARLAVARRGVVGTVTGVQVSSTHMYHATSLIRGFLGTGFDPVTVVGQRTTAPLADPLGKDGWTGSLEPQQAGTTIGLLDFGDGRTAVYDFTDNQWWNPLRARRIVVRGSLGEIVDDSVVRLVDPRSPVQSHLVRRQRGVDLDLEGVDLDFISFDGEVVYRNPFAGSRMSDDDVAVADILAATGRWVRGDGPAPYPLAEACQDHLVALAVEEAASSGRPVTTAREAWAG